MLKFLRNNTKPKVEESFETVVQGLRHCYMNKLLPLEKAYKYHEFHSSPLEEADFDAKPMIILIGQYSTGKTTFIRYLLEEDFPGMRIGPEPTTDGFIAIMHGEQRNIIPGNALVVDPTRQFRPLAKFGNEFLNRLQCAVMPNSVLQSLTIIDTPGILSGEKQRMDQRGYEFTTVIEWFVERVDRIILLFDAHKLDISDEFRRTIDVLKGYEDKIRIVLNKADMIDSQQLMRVYGALMWSLGKVLHTPEVCRVYIGSFWDQAMSHDTNRKLFELEAADLFHDLQTLPTNMALRKLNDLIRRARLAKVHAYVISQIKSEMPLVGKENKQKEIIQQLQRIYLQISREHQISMGDFPKVGKMQSLLEMYDFRSFSSFKPKLIEAVDEMLSKDISRLMSLLPQEQKNMNIERPVVGGAFVNHADNPFGFESGDGINSARFNAGWVVAAKRDTYDQSFFECNPVDGKISGSSAKAYMLKSKLPNAVLSKIWKLSDIDEDGFLDADEFSLACYLIDVKLNGDELPAVLPEHLIPPSKRLWNEIPYV